LLFVPADEDGSLSVIDLDAIWRQLFDCLGDDQRRLLGVGRLSRTKFATPSSSKRRQLSSETTQQPTSAGDIR
jgi:hypothetical protein